MQPCVKFLQKLRTYVHTYVVTQVRSFPILRV